MLSRSYDAHGVGIELRSADTAVLRAMDLRLRGFLPHMRGDGPLLRFRFLTRAPDPPPPADGRPVYETPHGTLFYFPERDLLAGALGDVTLYCEPASGMALISAPSFSERSLYLATHPVATVALMELMERLGHYSLHSACLSDTAGNGLLLAGPSGAGKSTLTLALIRGGMEFLGDDVVFLKRPDGPDSGLAALGFADALGIGSFAATRFPELAPRTDEAPPLGFPKRLHRFEDLFGRVPASSCVPRVIVFPEVAHQLPSALHRLDRGEALVRLVPDVLMTHPEASREHVAVIGELLTQVRCYEMRSGYDLDRAAELARALIS